MTITAEQIPDAVVDALLNSSNVAKPWNHAIAAALNAWPGMERERIGKGYEWPLVEEYTDAIILPLPPKEASDE